MKTYPILKTKHHSMKTYGGVEI